MRMTGFNIVRYTEAGPEESHCRHCKVHTWSKPAMYYREQAAYHRGVWFGIFVSFMFALIANGLYHNYVEKLQ